MSSLHCLSALVAFFATCHPAVAGSTPPVRHTDPGALREFADMRFGAMFHWGPAVLRDKEISWSMSNRAKYEAVYQHFNPRHFNADAWAGVAKAAGSRYVIYVCKHHDGFCMWDTKTTDNNIMNTPFGRDVTAELARACGKDHLVFGTYLSIMDIHEAGWDCCYPARSDMPGYPEGIPHIEDLTRNQSLELMKNYHSRFMWYDGAWLEGWRTSESPARVATSLKEADPKVLLTRLMNDVDDYECMEARVGAYKPVPWEMVTSVAYPTYSYNQGIKYKSSEFVIQTLSRVVCGNGNLLLNFAPDVDGAIPGEQLKLAGEVGGWLKTHGEAVYGTRGGPWYPGAWGGSTHKGTRIYLHMLPDAPEPLKLPPCGASVAGARTIEGKPVSFQQNDDGLEISLPAGDRDPWVSVVELRMSGEVAGMVEASRGLMPAGPRNSGDAEPPPREEIK